MNSKQWLVLGVNLILIVGLAFYVYTRQGVRTGFVYNQKVFNEYKGTKELQSKLNEFAASQKSRLDSLATLIQGGRQDLNEQYRMIVDESTARHAQMTEQYTAEVWKRINDAISDYGKENNYDYIFGAAGNGSLMYANDGNDLTLEITAYVNRKYEGD